jgi:lectin-like protein
MKTLMLLILAVLFATNIFAQCANETNIYEFTFEDKTYEIVKELQMWDVAAACAVERGGYLVEINSQEEQNAVYDAIINGAGISPTYVSINNDGGIAYIWIGATDQNEEGTWLWDGNSDNS